MATPPVSTNLVRGLLEPCLLSLLEAGPDYGLSLSQRLETSGIGPVPGGTLYPALLRLDRRGLVTTSWRPSPSGPARKYFELTPLGTSELAERRREWRRLSAALGGVIEGNAQETHTSADEAETRG
ncbi:PadR family transcriptional regulator [Actinomyces sp. 2119]|uniref:PadR family transcriptional regulator n=1 Tax=Actinomyces sp. 2119 TaxID=2321393 RepID=UPI000E6C46E0|nr:PadR family transcriptional regulator [Actinomyces sp. 2119]RJF43901.1 PadR family transcriptional regulator [Actinomyces sp. 2119]